MERDRSLDVAVTGMAGRLCGAANLEQLWAALVSGQTLVERLDAEHLRAAGVPDEIARDPAYVPVQGRVMDVDRFDHEFFSVSPREAQLLDPQQRLLLECAWQALEDAGHRMRAPDPLRTAVFASASSSQHMRDLLATRKLDEDEIDEIILANERDFLATRISYKLGLTGPALSVLTACSSSLVAAHLAIQALNTGECDQALVIAASASSHATGHLYTPGGIMSGTGACRPFDAAADGTVAGAGVLGVVLRRYHDAEAAKVPMYGVLLGSAVNNDGSGKAGYTAPSLTGQERVIEEAIAAAGIEASSVGYLEAHGTGTRIGDPIEWSAASAAYARLGASVGQIRVGAVKSVVGHLDSAAGLAGLAAALLVVGRGVIPPLAGLERPNPLLDLDHSSLVLPVAGQPWTGSDPRRAAVSSFGVGGTNAHVLIEQPPEAASAAGLPRADDDQETLIALSAGDADALDRMQDDLADYLERVRPDLAAVARTLAGRSGLSHRHSAVGSTAAQIARALRGRAPACGAMNSAARPAPLIFLLPGQGTQSPGMARPFAESLPGFTAALDTCLAEFGPAIADEVRDALHDYSFPAERMTATAVAQPALFALEYAAATALTGLGLHPAALAGHSIGELTAACLGGSLELGDAARLAESRGRLMQRCEPGSMLALTCSYEEAQDLLARTGATLEFAAVNATEEVVLSGPNAQIEHVTAALGDGPIRGRVLRTSHAFHSAAMLPAAQALRGMLAAVPMTPARIAWSRNIDGSLVRPGEVAAATGFADQVLRPVRFAEGLDVIAASYPGALAVEIGPGQVLSALALAAALDAVPLGLAEGSRRAGSAHPRQAVLNALGYLWSAGQPVDVGLLTGDGPRCHLPAYPFRGQRWPKPPPARYGEPDAQLRSEPTVTSSSATRPADDSTAEADPADLVKWLWREQLGDVDCGPAADFFELGGDSLAVTRLARRLGEVFGVQVPLRRLLAERTVPGQVQLLEDLLIEQLIAEATDTPVDT